MTILSSPLTLKMGTEVHLTSAKSLRSRVRRKFQARFCRRVRGSDSPFDSSGWQEDGNGTSQIRSYLGLEKDKKNKSEAKPETHAVDGVALACGYFVRYCRHIGRNTHGYLWKGKVQATDSVFRVITRPGAVKRGKEYGFFRRQLHFEKPDKSGTRKRKGGTVTPFGFRVNDLVFAEKTEEKYVGYVGGFTNTDKSKNISVYDYSWKRIGQFSPSKVKLLRRSNGLCVT